MSRVEISSRVLQFVRSSICSEQDRSAFDDIMAAVETRPEKVGRFVHGTPAASIREAAFGSHIVVFAVFGVSAAAFGPRVKVIYCY